MGDFRAEGDPTDVLNPPRVIDGRTDVLNSPQSMSTVERDAFLNPYLNIVCINFHLRFYLREFIYGLNKFSPKRRR